MSNSRKLHGACVRLTMLPCAFWMLLLTCLFVGDAGAADEKPNRIALVIGNSEYLHAPVLPNPRNDAEAIAAKLEELGFLVFEKTDLGLDETRDAIIDFGRASYGADVALIFYAGHGMQMNGENYLLPVDSSLASPEEFADTALREAELHSAFAFAQPKVSMIILDACRSNPMAGDISQIPGLSTGDSSSHELGRIRSSAGLLIMFSAAPGTVARDGVDGNSPFTTALLQWIDRPGLEIGPMVRRVRQTVLNLTSGSQIPWVEESLVDEVFLGPSVGGADQATLQLAELLTSTIGAFQHPVERHAAIVVYTRLLPGVNFEGPEFQQASLEVDNLSGERPPDRESLIWLSIRDSPEPEIFQTFIEEFPDSLFVPLAEERLAGFADRVETALLTEDAGPESAAEAVDRDAPVQLDTAMLAETEASLGLGNDDLRALQVLLAEAGDYGGAIDGMIGPGSRSALSGFQGRNGLLATGYLDDVTLLRLVGLMATGALRTDIGKTHRPAIHRLAAIADFGPGSEPEVIRVATHQRWPGVHDYWREIADDFEAEHPGTLIEYDIRPDIEYRQDLLIMLGSETPPDIYLTYGGGHLRTVAEAGFARDLTGEMGSGLALRYKPGALTNLMIEDRIFAVPMRMTLISFWANRRLLEQAGVDPASLETWSGLLDGIERLKSAGITPISVGAADAWPVGLYWGGLSQAIGGRGKLEDALGGRGEGFNDPVFVRAGELLRDLAASDAFQPNFLDRTENEAIGAFVDGYTAMTLNGDWLQARAVRNWPGGPELAVEELVRIPFPPGDLGGAGAGQPAPMTYGGVDSWVVHRDAPEAAVGFVEQLAGLNSQTAIAEMGFGIPAIAGADSAIADPILGGAAEELTLSEYHQLYFDQVLGPYAGEVLNDAAVAVSMGDLSPAEAAATIDTAWSGVRSEWGRSTATKTDGLDVEELETVE